MVSFADLYVFAVIYAAGRYLLSPDGNFGDEIDDDKGTANLNEENFITLLFAFVTVDGRLN
jgi:hypothetical protein